MSVEALLDVLRAGGLTVACGEGDTGGVLLEMLTAIPGSSATVLGGVVAYHDDLKRALLSVPAELIATHGSVSREVAEAMASGVRQATGADLGIATTGIAGPGGATPTKPVGLAFVAVTDGQRGVAREHTWEGDRAENRTSSAEAAIALTLEFLTNERNSQ